jgi:hypothetical protein
MEQFVHQSIEAGTMRNERFTEFAKTYLMLSSEVAGVKGDNVTLSPLYCYRATATAFP